MRIHFTQSRVGISPLTANEIGTFLGAEVDDGIGPAIGGLPDRMLRADRIWGQQTAGEYEGRRYESGPPRFHRVPPAALVVFTT
jgi:hypothetical protein